MSSAAEPDDRRRRVAASAIRLIARDGLRALTHRAVDQEAAIPQGSTSYYAKTRRALLELTVDELSARSLADAQAVKQSLAGGLKAGEPLTPDRAAAMITVMIEAMAARDEDMRARYALIMELSAEPALLARLTSESEVDRLGRSVTTTLLRRLGLAADGQAADDFVAFADALVFQQVVLGRRGGAERMLRTQLEGMLGGFAD